MTFHDKVAQVAGLPKREDETWVEFFDRLNTTRGIDIKVIAMVIALMLDEMQTNSK